MFLHLPFSFGNYIYNVMKKQKYVTTQKDSVWREANVQI
jgi:hypothetical protein